MRVLSSVSMVRAKAMKATWMSCAGTAVPMRLMKALMRPFRRRARRSARRRRRSLTTRPRWSRALPCWARPAAGGCHRSHARPQQVFRYQNALPARIAPGSGRARQRPAPNGGIRQKQRTVNAGLTRDDIKGLARSGIGRAVCARRVDLMCRHTACPVMFPGHRHWRPSVKARLRWCRRDFGWNLF